MSTLEPTSTPIYRDIVGYQIVCHLGERLILCPLIADEVHDLGDIKRSDCMKRIAPLRILQSQ